MTSKKLIGGLIYAAIILTPIFGFQDMLEFFPAFAGYFNIGPFGIIKAGKDILLAIIFILFFIDILLKQKFINKILLWSMLTIIASSFLITIVMSGQLIAFVGLRVFSPIILIFIAYKYVDMDGFRNIVKIICFIAILEFLIALAQMFYGSPISGINYLGLATRPFSTFAKPWSFSAFICCAMALRLGLDLSLYLDVKKRTWLFVALSIVFVVLSGSGAGLLGLLMIFMMYILFYLRVHKYVKISVVPILLYLPIWVYINLPWLTGRQRILSVSAATRYNIFGNLLAGYDVKEILIGKGLGIGSNASQTFMAFPPINVQNADQLFLADSFYTSVISQTGILFLFLFLGFTFYVLSRAWRNKYQGVNPVVLLFVPMVLTVSFAGIILELFPLNWLLFIIFGLALKEHKSEEAEIKYECNK